MRDIVCGKTRCRVIAPRFSAMIVKDAGLTNRCGLIESVRRFVDRQDRTVTMYDVQIRVRSLDRPAHIGFYPDELHIFTYKTGDLVQLVGYHQVYVVVTVGTPDRDYLLAEPDRLSATFGVFEREITLYQQD